VKLLTDAQRFDVVSLAFYTYLRGAGADEDEAHRIMAMYLTMAQINLGLGELRVGDLTPVPDGERRWKK
jgi:hypothetical protein